MTTIAYKDFVLAADTRAYSGHSTPIGHKQKIHKRRDGALIGISTATPGLSERVADWFQHDKNFDKIPQLGPEDGLDAIEIDAEGRVFIYHNNMHPTGPLTGPYFAVGSGANYAMGAFAMGASAPEAVQAGIMNDVWSGGEVNIYTHPLKQQQQPAHE